MATIHVRQLTNPTAQELDKASEVLAEAFKTDVFVGVCIGGDPKLNAPFQRATIAAAAIGGALYVASYGDHDIAGVAAWFGPGRALLDSPEQGEAGYNALMGRFPPELMKWWMEYFLPKYEEQTTTALGKGTKLAAWHLQMFGVLPELQGKGVGGALMKAMESKAHPQGIATCLEAATEKNVAMYKHWGYSVKGPEQYESSTGGFPLYVLIKESKVGS